MEVNIIFNAHKSYTDNFLPSLSDKLQKENEIILNEEDLFVYKKNEMKIMIDDSATVYFSSDNIQTSMIDSLLLDAIVEYKSLCIKENRFNKDTPVKIFIPKSNDLNNINWTTYKPFTSMEIDGEFAFTTYIT